MILDTSFIVDVMNGDKAALSKLQEIKEKNLEVNLTSITAFELYAGVEEGSKPETEKEKILEAMEKLSGDKIPFKWTHGKTSAKIKSNLKNEGEMIELQDIFLSSVAQQKEETVLTGNPDHFEKVDGIEVEIY